MFSVSITHNSKIKKLSDGNKKLETELCGAKRTSQLWVPPFLSYELWKQIYELWKSLIQTASTSSRFCNFPFADVALLVGLDAVGTMYEWLQACDVS